MKLFAVLLIFSFHANAQTTSQKDTWWFAEKQQRKAERIARKVGLKDTVISLEFSDLYLWIPERMDSTKETMLLAHGMGVNGITQWDNQLKAFSEHFNLIIPDMVGYDKSTNKQHLFSPDVQAITMHDAIQRLGITGKINVAGFSYGGLVTATYHFLYEKEVDKIAICDGPVKFFTPHIADSIIKSRDLSHFERLISPTNRRESDIFFDALFSGKAPWLNDRMQQNLIDHIFQVNAETKREQMKFLATYAENYLQTDYHFNNTNVLFLWGDLDGAIPYDVGKKLHAAYPIAKFHTVKGAKHDACVTFKEEFNEVLLKHFVE